MPDASTGYFVRTDDHAFRPTALTGGAWTPDEQHISPVIGLLTHEVERFAAARGDDGMRTGRISVDILGVLTLDEFRVDVEVVRGGRTIELLEATVTSRGRVAARARVWRMAAFDTAQVAGGAPEPLPDPDDLPSQDLTGVWPGGYIASLDFRPVGDPRPGRTTAWIGTGAAVVTGETVGPLAGFVALVDTANGIAVRQSPAAWLFPNLDLTIHLHRTPEGPWVGLDTTVVFGADGLGLTSTVLHDRRGPVGRAAQTLTIRARG